MSRPTPRHISPVCLLSEHPLSFAGLCHISVMLQNLYAEELDCYRPI